MATKLVSILEENAPKLTFCIDFFKVLSLFEIVRQKMLGKKLEENWGMSLNQFMNELSLFMEKSDSIGLMNFHLLSHSKNICQKFNVGLGGIGCDNTIESFHSHILTMIIPHLGKHPVLPDNSIAYDKENMPPQHVIDYHLNLFSRALEISMFEIPDKNEDFSHKDYTKNKSIDFAYVQKILGSIDTKPIHFDFKKKSDKFDQNIKKYIFDASLISQPQ